ncbi:MAG: PilZ domain-containing protein [Planctomycetia bacterium]
MSLPPERRRETRVPSSMPVRLGSGSQVLDVQAVDVSLSGVRLRVPLGALGLGPEAALGEAARVLRQRLGDAFAASLSYVTLGPLVRRVLRVAHLARVEQPVPAVVLGCEMRSPLGEAEVLALGLVLAELSAPPPPPADEHEAQRLMARAVLAGEAGPGREALQVTIHEARRARIVVALAGAQRLGALADGGDACALASAVDQRVGPRPTLTVLAGSQAAWSGPVRLEGLQWFRPQDMLHLDLLPDPPMDAAGRHALGLDS